MANQTEPTEQIPPEPTGGGTKWRIIVTVILVVVLIVIVVWAYLALSKREKAPEVAPTTPTQTSEQATVPTTTPSVSTANWKTYTNPKPNYTIKYPTDWKLDNSQATAVADDYELLTLTLTKNDHTLEISMPRGYGGSVCAFSDSPSLEEGPGVTKFPGEPVEIANPNYSSRPFRRSTEPTASNEKTKVQWQICQKEADSDYFVNATVVDLVKYIAPTNYDETILKEMDEIIKTLKATLR